MTAAGGLTPGWVAGVPAMFRSAAESIEHHRFRLVGDSAALRALAVAWRAQSQVTEGIWSAVGQVRGRVRSAWQGPAAGAFDRQAEQFSGEVSGTGVSLAFASEGLLLAADTIDRTRRAADQAVIAYVTRIRQLYETARTAPAQAQNQALATLVAEGNALGQRTLQAVYAQEVTLDAFLASMPRRFQIGPGAPWREGLPTATDNRDTSNFTAALTLFGVRTTRREGVTVTTMADGRVMVAFDDYYAMGAHLSAGSKISLGDFPEGVQQALRRAYGEFEAAPVLNYQQRYTFANQAEADAFLARLDGDSIPERVGSAVRNAAGWVTGPIADFGPWHDGLLGRSPDERTFHLGGMVKANADAGAWPVAGAMATAQGDTGVTVTVRADGSSSWQVQVAAQGKVGGTVEGLSGNLGIGQGAISRVDYDAQGNPTRYVVQDIADRDYTYHGGTNNTGVGVVNPTGPLVDGVQVKADSETVNRTVTSHYLDLTVPENRAAFEHAHRFGDPVPPAAGELGERLQNNGVTVTEHYTVDRNSGEVGGKVGAGVTFGVKGGPSGETVTLVDSQYVDASRSDRLYPTNPSPARPLPRDPR